MILPAIAAKNNLSFARQCLRYAIRRKDCLEKAASGVPGDGNVGNFGIQRQERGSERNEKENEDEKI